jgi:PAS domain-containing protein
MGSVAAFAGGSYTFWKKVVVPARKWMGEWMDLVRELRPRDGGSPLYDRIAALQASLGLVRNLQRAQMTYDGRARFEVDAKGTCVWVNREFCLVTGSTESENFGFGWHNILHPEDAERFLRDWQSAFEGCRDLRGVYMLANSQLGDPPPPFDLTVTVFRDDAGRLLGGLGLLEPHRVGGGEYMQIAASEVTPARGTRIPAAAVREPTGPHRLQDRGPRSVSGVTPVSVDAAPKRKTIPPGAWSPPGPPPLPKK